MIVEKSHSNFNQALWLSISYACSMLVGILSAAILSRCFDKAEYGTYRQILYVYQILFTVFQAGLPSVFTYFLPRYTKEENKYIVKKVNQLLFLLGVVCSLLLFFTSNIIASILNNPGLSIGLKIFSFFPLFTLPTLGVEGIYTVNKNTKFVAIYTICTRLFMLACIVLPVIFMKNDYRYALIGWGIASFIAFIIAIIAKNRVYNNVEIHKVPQIMHNVFQYSLPIMGSAIVFMFFNSANQFFISRYFGIEIFAEYSNGYMTLPFAIIFIAPIRLLITPIFAKAAKERDYSNALKVLYDSTKQIFVLMIPVIVFAFCFAKEIMTFLYGSAYEFSYIFFRMILIFNFVEMFVFSSVLSAIGKTAPEFYFVIVCTVILWFLDFLLIKIDFADAYMITGIFIFLNILVRYVLPGIYLVVKGRIVVINRDVCVCMIKILTHALIVALLIVFISNIFLVNSSAFIRLISFMSVFYIVLIFTSSFIGVNYLQAILRLMKIK